VNKKVLIVDDEPHIRLLLEQTLDELEEAGVEILLASNGGDALDIVQEERPDLVLLDVMMPVKNGFEVCRAIKGDPDLRDIYIILLTAKGQEFDRAHGEEVGSDLYMTKPFDPDEVLDRVAEVLGIELA
jgi:DNA-binding response OmpR family regulator